MTLYHIVAPERPPSKKSIRNFWVALSVAMMDVFAMLGRKICALTAGCEPHLLGRDDT